MYEWIFDEAKNGPVVFEGKRFATSLCNNMSYAVTHIGEWITERGGIVENSVAEKTDYVIFNELGSSEKNYQEAKKRGIRCVFFDRLMFEIGEYYKGDTAQMIAFACIMGSSLEDEKLRAFYTANRDSKLAVFNYCLRSTPQATGNLLAFDAKILNRIGLQSFLALDRPTVCYHWLLNQKAFGNAFGKEAAAYIEKNRKKVAYKIVEADDAEAMQAFLKLRGETKPAEQKEYLQLAKGENKSNIVALLAEDVKQGSENPKNKEKPASSNTEELKYNWSFKKKEDGTILITAYKGKKKEVAVPDRIGKAPVTEIGDDAFSPDAKRIQNADIREEITKITVPDTVKALGDGVFHGCRLLKTIELPDSLEKIGRSVFGGCRALESIRLPRSLSGILQDEFKYCTSLQKVFVPDGITEIGWDSFEGCKKLKELHVGAGVKSFAYCSLEDAKELTIFAPAGSFAEQYAKKHKITFEAV